MWHIYSPNLRFGRGRDSSSEGKPNIRLHMLSNDSLEPLQERYARCRDRKHIIQPEELD
jgi:hypothetical protein